MLAICAATTSYLAGLESVLPSTQMCVVGGTGAPLAAMMRRGGVTATTLDEHEALLRAIQGPLSAGVVLGAAPIAQLLEEVECDAVFPFKSGSRLWKMAEWQGLRVLAAPHLLTRQLENKLALAEIAEAAEARIPDTVTIRLDAGLATAALAGDVALPRVFQPAVGFAGAGTLLLRDPRDVEALVEHPPGGVSVGKLVEYVDGDPVTVNGVVVPPGVHGAGADGEVLVGMVARQLTGLAGLTPTEFGSCGNDWTMPPPRSDIAAVRALAQRIGEVLASRGFAGAFGIDVMLPSGGGLPVLIEINPRWTASLSLQVELQKQRGLPTLLDAHLAAFEWRVDERANLDELREAFGYHEHATCTQAKIVASTVIAYNATGGDVKVPTSCEPGVWRASSGEGLATIERVRDGWRIADLDDDDEFVLLPQGAVRAVPHGSYLYRVVLRSGAALDARAGALRPQVQRITDACSRMIAGR